MVRTDVDEAEFRAFVALASPSLRQTARLLVHDAGQAEDLVQVALTHSYTHWHRVLEPSARTAYARTTLVRAALRWRAHRARAERPAAQLPDVTGRDPSADVDLAEAVRGALARLPPEQRAVLVLRYFHDLDEAEIARVLDCAPGTVKSRAARAIAALRGSGLLDDEPADTTGGPR